MLDIRILGIHFQSHGKFTYRFLNLSNLRLKRQLSTHTPPPSPQAHLRHRGVTSHSQRRGPWLTAIRNNQLNRPVASRSTSPARIFKNALIQDEFHVFYWCYWCVGALLYRSLLPLEASKGLLDFPTKQKTPYGNLPIFWRMQSGAS